MIIVSTINISEEFYTKLYNMNIESIRLCVNNNKFQKLYNVVHDKITVIITTYSTASKGFGDLIEEYYYLNKRLDYFLVIEEAVDDIKWFCCFKDNIIINPNIDEKYNRKII